MVMSQPSPFAPRPQPTATTAAAASAPPTHSVSDFLSARPIPQALPPSQSYAVLCKLVLQKRLKHSFVLTLAATYLALLAAVFDPKGLPGSLFNFLPVLLFAPIAFLGALPIFVLRKRTITTALPSTNTRFAQIASLRSPAATPVFISYLVGSVPILVAYLWCAGYVSSDAKLGLLFYHKGRDSWILNERRIFLSLLHVFVAGYAAVEHVVNSRSQVQFDEGATRTTIPVRLTARAQARAPFVVRSALVANAFFYTGYLLLRRPILRFLVVNFAGAWARPYLYTILRHNAAYSFTLAARSLASSFFAFAVWEAAHVCFETYATQPMSVSHFAPNANATLLSGLRSSDPYFQSFAYLELATITLTSPERRQAIFKEIKAAAARGGAWTDISRECLLLIGTELQRAKGRGKIAAKPSDSTAGPSASLASTSTLRHSASSVSIKSGDVFKPTKKTFFDSLAAPASTAAGPRSASTTALAPASTTTVSRVPSIFQTSSAGSTSSAPSTGTTTAATAAPAKPAPWSLESTLATYAPASIRVALFTSPPAFIVGACVPRQREVIWAISSLSNLLCASLREDPYGVAQRDIPKVLEGFVLYLNVLDGLAKEFEEAAASLDKERKEETIKEVTERVGAVQSALRDGVREILAEFEPYLGSFRFPTAIATRLQLLVDWG